MTVIDWRVLQRLVFPETALVPSIGAPAGNVLSTTDIDTTGIPPLLFLFQIPLLYQAFALPRAPCLPLRHGWMAFFETKSKKTS